MNDSCSPLLTAQEVAELARVHIATVHRWAKRGTIPVVRIDGTIRFRRDDIAYLLSAEPEATNHE